MQSTMNRNNIWIQVVTVVYCTSSLLLRSEAQATVEYCEGETFDASCESGSIVLLTWARYGRMQLGKCLKTDYGQLGCQVDVTRHMDSLCSGRTSCSVRVSSIVDELPDGAHRCPTDLRSYLQAQYICVPVETKPGNVCPPEGYATVNSSMGYIASTTFAEGSQLGLIDCPWQIRVQPGQRVNITMYDFATEQHELTANRGGPEICHVYLSIKESKLGTSDTVCAGSFRIRTAYTSMTDTVEVRIVSAKGRNLFLLKYEAIDCPNPTPPAGGYIERINPGLAIMRCNHTDQIYRIYCRNDDWADIPRDLSCPGTDISAANRISVESSVHDRLWSFISGTQEISIIIIVCVAMVIGCTILMMGLVCIRRKRILHDSRHLRGVGPRGGPSIVSVYQAAPQKDGEVTEYHEQRVIPPQQGGEGYPTQNDYYRTWQLRHGSQPRAGYGPLPPVPSNQTMSRTHSMPVGREQRLANRDDYAFEPVEHIYESPKFERRELQYYELDPSSVQEDSTHITSRMGSPLDYPNIH